MLRLWIYLRKRITPATIVGLLGSQDRAWVSGELCLPWTKSYVPIFEKIWNSLSGNMRKWILQFSGHGGYYRQFLLQEKPTRGNHFRIYCFLDRFLSEAVEKIRIGVQIMWKMRRHVKIIRLRGYSGLPYYLLFSLKFLLRARREPPFPPRSH